MHAIGKKTILLAEDHDDVRSMLRHILERLGYTVLQAEDGLAALEAAETAGPIDVLVTDVSMPCMSGPELARRLTVLRPGLKVLFMSAHDLGGHDLAGACLGPPRLLRKPFRPEELAAELRRLLERRTDD